MTTTDLHPAPDTEVDKTVHDHPSDWMYVKVAVFLAILTALEVGTYFLEDPSTTLLVALLFPMMIVKFGTVIMYFMHLKYDNPLFKRVFLFGLILAVVVYGVVFTAFEFFDDRYLRFIQS